MGVSEQIADARHWVTEHKLKAIGTEHSSGAWHNKAFETSGDAMLCSAVLQADYGQQELLGH